MSNVYREVSYHVDGAVSKKPKDSIGPARCAFVNLDNGVKVVYHLGLQTISFAEYMGLICALCNAIANRYEFVNIYTDSQLVCQQINGNWEVKAENLKGLFNIAKVLLDLFLGWKVIKIKSNENKADLK